MSSDSSGDDGTDYTDSKVGRVIQSYDLDGMGEELEARWTGRQGDRESLRQLADRFNRAVLGAAMSEAGMEPLDGEVANTYRLLTDDDVSSGMRTQSRRRLESEGVDVETVERDFVSHQAIHTYLTDFREVEHATDRSGDEQARKDADTIRRLRSRTQAVTESTLDRLARGGSLSVGTFDVLVDVRVLCEDCGTYYDVSELLEKGSCDCEG